MKAPINKKNATILLGGGELVGAITSVLLVHSTGKRPLVFVSLIGTGFCFFATATYAHFLGTVAGVSVDNVVTNNNTQIIPSSYVNERNLTDVFNNFTDKFLWIPLTLMIVGAVLSHLGQS